MCEYKLALTLFFCFVLEYRLEEEGIITRSRTEYLRTHLPLPSTELPYSTYCTELESEFTDFNNYITEFYRTEPEFTMTTTANGSEATNNNRDPAPHLSRGEETYQNTPSRPRWPIIRTANPEDMNDYELKFGQTSRRFERATKAFDTPDKIEQFAAGFESSSMVCWYEDSYEEFCKLSFDAFILRWKVKFGPRDYIYNLLSIARSATQGSLSVDAFFKLQRDIQQKVGKISLTNGMIVMNMVQGFGKTLRIQIRNDKFMEGTGVYVGDVVVNVTDFAKGFNEPPLFLNDFVIRASYHHNLAAETTRSQHQHSPAPHRANVAAVQEYTQWMDPLTPRERAYLVFKGGCFKCRQVVPNHPLRSPDCPGFAEAKRNPLIVPADFQGTSWNCRLCSYRR